MGLRSKRSHRKEGFFEVKHLYASNSNVCKFLVCIVCSPLMRSATDAHAHAQMLFYVNACAVQQIRAKLTVAAYRSTRERRRPHYFTVSIIGLGKKKQFKGKFVK